MAGEANADGSWYDSTDIVCLGCGFRASMSVDEDGAYLNWDDTDPHNIACYEAEEAKP